MSDAYQRAMDLERQQYADEMRLKQEWWDSHRDDMVLQDATVTRMSEQEVLDKMALDFEFDNSAMRELYIMIHPKGEGAEECPSST